TAQGRGYPPIATLYAAYLATRTPDQAVEQARRAGPLRAPQQGRRMGDLAVLAEPGRHGDVAVGRAPASRQQDMARPCRIVRTIGHARDGVDVARRQRQLDRAAVG